MAITVKTHAASEPVTVEEAKTWCRQRMNDEDALFPMLIATARSKVEAYLRRPLISRELTERRTGLGRFMVLPVAPVITVDQVRYIDTSGASQVLASDQYRVLTHEALPVIYPATGISWPSVLPEPDTVEIDMTAGYGDASDLPPEFRAAVLLLVGYLYENREAMQDDVMSLPSMVAELLNPKVLWI